MDRFRITTLSTALALSSALFSQVDRTLSKSDGSAVPEQSASTVRPASDASVGTPWMDRMMVDASRNDLPYIHEFRPLGASTTGFTAHLTGTTYVELTPSEVAALPGLGDPGPAPELRSTLGYARKKPVAQVDIYPYRRNPATGRVERLVDYSLELVEDRRAGAGRPKSGTYPDNSKMASGEWYRFSVPEDGVYRITYDFLAQLGVNMAGLASDRINVYGNHAGQLPFRNSPFIPTDLLTNAIEVVDGGDGQFGPNDQILFYASGPQRWDYNATTGRFVHTKNVYSDSACYFIGIDVEAPKRVVNIEQTTDPATDQITAFTDHQVIDRDLVNHLKSGRTWYSETFDLTTTYNYNFNMPYLRQGDPLCVAIDVLSRTIGLSSTSQWTMTVGNDLFTFNDSGISGSYSGQFADSCARVFCTTYGGNSLPITVTMLKNDPITSKGWMNFLAVNARRDLRFIGDQLIFRDPTTVGEGRVGEFILDQATSVQRIWDITDPTTAGNVAYSDAGASRSFRLPTTELREFIAFKNTGYLTPTAIGRVPNQNLHATALPVDLMIICPPEFQGEASRLADRRASEGLAVMMVDPQRIYNEFSSGARDATAIKRFMRMLYDRAGSDETLIPRYLLLFGDGSYNNISIAASNQNYIPSFQSYNSWLPSACFTSDDYFGLLDDNEGEANADILDIGVGRLPVSDVAQARDVVTKLLTYDQPLLGQIPSAASCTSGSDGGASDWRNWVLFTSDDMSGDTYESIIHMSNSNVLANEVELREPCLNIAKIYLDAYVQQSTPGGQRYPDAERALRDRVQKGCLLVNYVGHGGEVGWAHERLLDVQTILNWSNLERLPLFVTATCEFTRWDDPARTSAGELVFLNPNGGGIGLMTTTRIAYSGANQILLNKFYDYAFLPSDELGHDMRFGDMYRRTKVAVSGSDSNYRNFCLLGDPSTRLAQARNEVRITAITDTMGTAIDTLKALATVRIRGEITDTMGTVLSDFNGAIVPTVFDKATTVSALLNDGGTTQFPFSLRKNIIYRGNATVQNGQFSFTFVVPKDINYQVGPGRISIYAENAQTNACGYTNDPKVGSSDPNAAVDDQGPRIDLFMNDERFVPGGITDEQPLLFAKLFDDNGINTLGSSIGHDLTAVVDANTENAIVLNDVYEADLDTYKSGKIRYRLSELAEGGHTLDLKAWDVYNNSSTKSLDFVVAPSAELALAHVLNYPNPFTTSTQFFFEHNRPCSILDVQVQVFTVAGRLVKTLSRQLACDGYRSEPLAWDGLDDQGDKLGRGVYVYRLSVANEQGEAADKVEKLVILR